MFILWWSRGPQCDLSLMEGNVIGLDCHSSDRGRSILVSRDKILFSSNPEINACSSKQCYQRINPRECRNRLLFSWSQEIKLCSPLGTTFVFLRFLWLCVIDSFGCVSTTDVYMRPPEALKCHTHFSGCPQQPPSVSRQHCHICSNTTNGHRSLHVLWAPVCDQRRSKSDLPFTAMKLAYIFKTVFSKQPLRFVKFSRSSFG